VLDPGQARPNVSSDVMHFNDLQHGSNGCGCKFDDGQRLETCHCLDRQLVADAGREMVTPLAADRPRTGRGRWFGRVVAPLAHGGVDTHSELALALGRGVLVDQLSPLRKDAAGLVTAPPWRCPLMTARPTGRAAAERISTGDGVQPA
jgi:hypothetical protein